MSAHSTASIASRHPIHGIQIFSDVTERDNYTYIDDDVGKVVKVSSPLGYYLVLSQNSGTGIFSELGRNTGSQDDFSYFDPEVSTTTSTFFQTRLEFSTPSLTGGKYRFYVSYGWNCSSASRSIEVQLQYNSGLGYIDLMEPHVEEPKDASGVFGITGSNQRMYLSRIFEKTLDPGDFSWRLCFRSAHPSTSVSMWETLVRLVRE